MELSDSLFKATRAELEQQVAERKEENNCYEEKIKMKESDIAMRMRHFAEMATTQKEWEAEKAKELKEPTGSQAKEILKLRAKLQKEKLSSTFQIVAAQEIEIIDQKNIHLVPRSPSGPRLDLRTDVSYLQIHNCDYSFCFI